MEEILKQVITILTPILTLLVTLISLQLTNYINTKIKNEKLKNAINLVKEQAVIIVNSLNQTLVEQLKAFSADGKLTQDEISNIKSIAYSKLAEILPDATMNFLSSQAVNVEELLSAAIEATIAESKRNQ